MVSVSPGSSSVLSCHRHPCGLVIAPVALPHHLSELRLVCLHGAATLRNHGGPSCVPVFFEATAATWHRELAERRRAHERPESDLPAARCARQGSTGAMVGEQVRLQPAEHARKCLDRPVEVPASLAGLVTHLRRECSRSMPSAMAGT